MDIKFLWDSPSLWMRILTSEGHAQRCQVKNKPGSQTCSQNAP